MKRAMGVLFFFVIALAGFAIAEDPLWFLAPSSGERPAVPTSETTTSITPSSVAPKPAAVFSTSESSLLTSSAPVPPSTLATPEVTALSVTPGALSAPVSAEVKSALLSPEALSAPVSSASTTPDAGSISSSASVETSEQFIITEEILPDEPIKQAIKYPVASKKTIEAYLKRNKKIPDKIRSAIKAGKAKIGMNAEALSLIFGEPLRIIERQVKKDYLEVWVIESEIEGTGTLIGLKNNKVIVVDNKVKISDAEKMMGSLK